MNIEHALMIALIEYWGQEIRMFHAHVGTASMNLESMTIFLDLRIDKPPNISPIVTLEDVAVLLVLRINGHPVIAPTMQE